MGEWRWKPVRRGLKASDAAALGVFVGIVAFCVYFALAAG
jgi:hypothetical protein